MYITSKRGISCNKYVYFVCAVQCVDMSLLPFYIWFYIIRVLYNIVFELNALSKW